jgi:hypothetical protein
MIISLKDFVASGTFGPIKIGMTTKEVTEFLGKPIDVYETEEAGFLSYGWYEFFYLTIDRKISGIQNKHLIADCDNHGEMIFFENDTFKIDPWFLETGKDFTYKDVKNILEKEGLKYFEETPQLYDSSILKFKNGVYLEFSGGFSGWGADDENSDNWLPFEKTIDNIEDFILISIGISSII